MTSSHVVVIGAGCAGLSAATALAEAGVRVTVVEARPVLGGRTFATVNRATGDWVDNGQHVIFGCYHDTLTYLDRIGTRALVHVQGPLTAITIDRRGVRSELRCPSLPSPLHLAAGVLAWDALSWRDRLSIRGIEAALAPDAPPLRDETVRAWLGRHGQSERLVELLWEPLAVAALNESIDRAAAGPFAEVVRRILGPGPDDASMAWPADSLSHVLIDPAARYVESRGGSIVAGCAATVSLGDGRAAGARVRDREVPADAVISSVPWHAFSALFEAAPGPLASLATCAAARRAEAIVTVNLWFDRDVLGTTFVGMPGRRFQWAFDKSRVTPGRARHLSVVASAANQIADLGNDALIALAIDELGQAVPAVRRATLLQATAVRERRATFSLASSEPERPGTVTALPGFFMAGDWTETGLPATIESAVISGHRAAAAVLHALGHTETATARRFDWLSASR
jgi:hydroxysqualene dehydroxylase